MRSAELTRNCVSAAANLNCCWSVWSNIGLLRGKFSAECWQLNLLRDTVHNWHVFWVLRRPGRVWTFKTLQQWHPGGPVQRGCGRDASGNSKGRCRHRLHDDGNEQKYTGQVRDHQQSQELKSTERPLPGSRGSRGKKERTRIQESLVGSWETAVWAIIWTPFMIQGNSYLPFIKSTLKPLRTQEQLSGISSLPAALINQTVLCTVTFAKRKTFKIRICLPEKAQPVLC